MGTNVMSNMMANKSPEKVKWSLGEIKIAENGENAVVRG